MPAQKWLDGLEEEFFSQGDFEASIGLPITPFMDRSMPGISSKQARCPAMQHASQLCSQGLLLPQQLCLV